MMVRVQRAVPGVLKVAATGSAVANLRRETPVLSRLQSDERLGTWRALLPVPLDAGSVDGGAFLLTSRLPGQRLPPHAARRLTSTAVHVLAPLHCLGRTVREVDDTLLNLWVDEPAERIARAIGGNASLNRLVAALHTDLAGRRVTLGWTHGDFYAGNLLSGVSGGVSGIVDWSQAREQDLLALDLAFWLLTVPARGQPLAFGARWWRGWTSAGRALDARRELPDRHCYGWRPDHQAHFALAHMAAARGQQPRQVRSLRGQRAAVAPQYRSSAPAGDQ